MKIPQVVNRELQIFNHGFTLVEVMLVAVLFSIMFAVAFDVLLSGRRSFDAASIRRDIEANAALGLNNMARELKNSASSQIAISLSEDSIEFSVPTGYDENGDIIWGAGVNGTENNRIRYLVNGTRLERERLSGITVMESRVLAHYVDSVSFINQTNGLLMNITTSEENKVTKERLDENLSSTITFRN